MFEDGIKLKISSEITLLYTELEFASFLSGCFIIFDRVNRPDVKLANRTSVHCIEEIFSNRIFFVLFKNKIFELRFLPKIPS